MDILVLFGQMLVLFAMMMTGYFAYRRQWLTDDTSARVSKLVVNVFNPILVINGVLGKDSKVGADKVASNLALIALYFVILIVFSYVLVLILRPKKERRCLYRLMATFSNLGFMGIPVVKSIYGDGAIIYVAFYILVYNVLLYTYGLALTQIAAREYRGLTAENSKETKSLAFSFKRMINPGVIASVIAIVIFALHIETPSFVDTFCDYMGNTTIPLSMILIGVSIAQADLKSIFTDLRMYLFILIRMVALPILLIFLMKGLDIDSVVFGVFIVELGMPIGSIITLMSKESGADADYCGKGTVLTTLASIITIPVICAFL